MADTSKKKPRKSKLVLRDCVEIDDDEYEDIIEDSLQMQEPVPIQEPPQALLPKLRNAIDTESYLENVDSPVKFDIQVDIETCENENEELEDTGILPSHEVIIRNDAMMKEVEKLSKLKTYSDRRLIMEIRNFIGKYPENNEVPDKYEEMIINIVNNWKLWQAQSKTRTTVSTYKCNICSIGWWHLGPFREHIRIHNEVTLTFDSFQHESSVVAAQGQWFETMCLCKIEGKCPKCLRTYEQHSKLRRNTLYYHCEGCLDKFPTCAVLFEHEGQCVRYEKKVFENVVPSDSLWKCDICDIVCLTQARYEDHYVLFHDVRSDLPVNFPLMRTCNVCSARYHFHPFHSCPRGRADATKCRYCFRRFQHKLLADMHMMYTKKDYSCRICKRYLERQCMETEHLLKHSKNFLRVFKCTECADNVLLATEPLMMKHKSAWHAKRWEKRAYYRSMIVPRRCMTVRSIWADGVTVADMVINGKPGGRRKNEAIMNTQQAGATEGTTSETVEPDVIQEQETEDEVAKEKEAVDEMCAALKNKMLKRACSNSAQGSKTDTSDVEQRDELAAAIEALKDDTNDFDVTNKHDILDDDIEETQNSVDALLSFKKIKNAACDNDDKARNEDDDIEGTQNSVDALLSLKNTKNYANEYDERTKIEDDDIEETQNSVDALLSYKKLKNAANEIDERTRNEDDDIEETQNSVDALLSFEKIKNDAYDEQTRIEDDDIEETRNSVNALLNEANFKDEIEIEEPNWEQIIIIDSDDDSQESREKTKDKTQEVNSQVNLAIVKQEPGVERDGETHVPIEVAHIIKTEVDIKQETEEMDEIEKEQDACMEELSKVFRASKDAGTLRLTGISLAEEITIKDEPMDEDDYEDDIIMFNDNATANEAIKTESDISASETGGGDLNAEIDMCKLEPEIRITQEPFAKILTNTGEMIIQHDKKLYNCTKCNFIGEHKKYKDHKITTCTAKNKNKKNINEPNRSNVQSQWNIKCTKCDTSFNNLRSYFLHFKDHDFRENLCPVCGKDVPKYQTAVHMSAHVKRNFVKLHVLSNASYRSISLKKPRIHQCKICQGQVEFKQMFRHWERHLELQPREEQALVVDESRTNGDGDEPKLPLQLAPDKLNELLEQVKSPMEGREAIPRRVCALCARSFSRRTDIKRHVIEHLLRDAQSRGPVLTCQICQYRTEKTDQYKMHMRNHASMPVFKCEMCDKWFSDSSNFAKHKKVHNLHVLSQCDLCKKKFHSKKGLESHMKMHQSTEPVQCGRCDRIFFTPSAYRKHVKLKHEKLPMSRPCRYCLQKFSTMRDLWDHVWAVHKERQAEADCPICHEQFRKFQDVRKHLRSVHREYQLSIEYRPLGKKSKKKTKKLEALQDTSEDRANRNKEDDVEAFLENHKEIEAEDLRETLVVFDDG